MDKSPKAVALKYDQKKDTAPRVIASGRGDIAEKIIAVAREHNVPPYVIFHDATLREMIEQRPGTLEQMLGLTGVGQKKLERYGQTFLDVLHGAHAQP